MVFAFLRETGTRLSRGDRSVFRSARCEEENRQRRLYDETYLLQRCGGDEVKTASLHAKTPRIEGAKRKATGLIY
jgi:hypothetical protein